MTKEIWQSLIREIDVTGASASSCVGVNLETLEQALGFKFPRGYKEFCEVFGSGELGGFIRIYCFCFSFEGESVGIVQELQAKLGLEALRTELSWEMERLRKGIPCPVPLKLSLVERVLPKAFVFGDDPNAHLYLWDLDSYDESDGSCDIYLVPTDDLDGTSLIGRDFFEFVSEFCMGSRAQEVLPADFHFYEEFTGKTFFRFGRENV